MTPRICCSRDTQNTTERPVLLTLPSSELKLGSCTFQVRASCDWSFPVPHKYIFKANFTTAKLAYKHCHHLQPLWVASTGLFNSAVKDLGQ